MVDPVNPFEKAQGIETILKQQGIFSPSPLTREGILEQRRLVSGLPGLEPYDYASQLEEAQGMGKLQLALALAQRGFAAAGATPVRGETPVSTLSRELLSPLAGDAGAVATQMMQQRQAAKLAERADKARLSQAALTMTQQHLAQEDVARKLRFSLAKSLVERDYTPTKNLQRKVDGKWVDFIGFYYTDKVTNLPKYAGVNKDGELQEVPMEELREYRKPDEVAALKATGATREARVIWVPVPDGKGGSRLEKRTVMQAVQLIPDTSPTGPRQQFGQDLYFKGTDVPFLVQRDGKLAHPTSGIDYLPSDASNYKDPTRTQLYVRALTDVQLAKAKNLLGKNIEVGEGVNHWISRHDTDPTQHKSLFDIKGRTLNITQAEADEYLTTEKPKIEDEFPPEGKQFGTTSKDLTVTDKQTGLPKTITAVLWQSAPGIFRWKEIGTGGKYVDEKYAKEIWGTIDEDKVYQSLRPVLDGAFTSAVEKRTGLEPVVRESLSKQILTTAELKRLAPITDESKRNQVIDDLINARIGNLTGERGETPVVIPQSVLDLDPRVGAMTTVPENAGPTTVSVINPRILQPWTRGGKNIQLGTGSHGGYSIPVTQDDIVQGRKNWPAIKQAFEQIYGGQVPLGDAEERILLFSGLWKNLPGVAERQKTRTITGQDFRDAFDKAAGLYNDAAKQYKSAAELNIGQGAQAKNLQTSLDDHLDAIRDNVIMLRFKDQAGAWFSDGTWLAEMRGTGLGELVEAWSGTDGVERDMPSDRWADIAKPDDQLNAKDLALKKKALAYLAERSNSEKGLAIGLTEFERAAEYLGALSRYKIRAFEMIKDSRPSDRDIEILLAAFVGERDSDSVVFAKLHELQNRHVNGLSRRLNHGLSMNAIYDPVFLADLDHTSRALRRLAVRDVDPTPGGRAGESADLFRRSSETIRRAAEDVSGRIIPGHRGGVISPFSGNVDEASTANLYRRVLSAAKEAYPDMDDQAAVAEFVRQGLHLTKYLGVYGGTRQTTAPYVLEQDGSITIQ